MRTETKNRIANYNSALPRMKERVIAAGFAVLIAAVIAVSATFAWVTLSRAPEVSAITTTLAANGALEIALSNEDGDLPSDDDFDESLGGISTNVAITNLQWGNLVNLSDPSYGIGSLILRPAELDKSWLTSNPLKGAEYGSDGRVSGTSSKYIYAKWNGSQFLSSTKKGVRAIASYTVETSDASIAEYELEYKKVTRAQEAVNAFYQTNIVSKDSIGALGSCIGTYFQAKINGMGKKSAAGIEVELGDGRGTDLPMSEAEVQALYNFFRNLDHAMELEKEAIVALANLQQYRFAKEKEGTTYTSVTWETVVSKQTSFDGSKAKANPKTPEEAISIDGLVEFIKDTVKTEKDLALLKELLGKAQNGETVTSSQIREPVNDICDPNSCLVEGMTINELTGKASKLEFGFLTDDDKYLITVQKGLLTNFERMAVSESYRLPNNKSSDVNKATIKVVLTRASGLTGALIKSYFGREYNPWTLYGYLCTAVGGGTSSTFSKNLAKIPADISTADKIAQDTYGMAIDFWVRSNQESTDLKLEGAVVTDTDGTIKAYNGLNRVWGATGNMALTTDSTTQGSGSCYVYYADTPEDLSRSLALMSALRVAFIDPLANGGRGELLATAKMDTENYLAVNGRVTIPLFIDNDDNVIQHMAWDEGYMITAIIYLDGVLTENTDVLAASNIEGQLNLQFGSSEKMITMGDNELLTAVRSVKAVTDKDSFDYDKDTDLSTTITVNVEGEDPENMEAFFVRAVNTKQGQRCGKIDFKKVEKNKWEGEFSFPLPGTYYLRYIRMDRVDYALEDPCKVQVDGFAVASVSWGEGVLQEKTVYSTENSYHETVSVKFAVTEGNRVPESVEVQFVRDDGYPATVVMKYNATEEAWEGATDFVASGEYTLSYLVINGAHYDISKFAKVINLHLGLKATVYNNGSPLTEEYSEEKVYGRKVQLVIRDDSNQLLEGLENLRLYYANGASIVKGVSTVLKWNAVAQKYEGELPITAAGRYRFSSIDMNGSSITRVTSAPEYIIMPPDPPIYNDNSTSEYTGANVNFVPLKANAVMGPIQIANSASASVSAVLYNDQTQKYYVLEESTADAAKGEGYIANQGDNTWLIHLPTYQKNNDESAPAIQDGTWQLVCLKLWECFDGTANEDNYRNESHPMIWLGKTAEAASYAATEDLTVDQTLDFSKLTTTVSCTVNVNMTEGTTELGSRDAAFMTQHKVSELGMKVTITDDAGRNIPADKLGSVELNVNYAANTAKNYGYEVSAVGNKDYAISMVQQSDGSWQPDSQANVIWQYVGEYEVNNLSVRVGEKTQMFAAGKNGVPEKYTVTSQAPTAANLAIKSAKLDQTEFGKSNGAVTGAFLAAYPTKVTVEMTFSPLDVNKQMYAVVPGMSITVDYQYQNGTSVPNGGYSWTGVTGYENHRDTCDNPDVSAEKYSFTATSKKTLLAGRYSVTGTLHWTEDGKEQTKSVGNLDSINVWSVQPTVTVTGVSPTGSVVVNPAGGTAATTSTENLFVATNHSGPSYASVYMAYDVSTKNGTYNGNEQTNEFASRFADYTAPTVSLKIENAGNFDTVFEANGGSQTLAANFTPSSATATITVGKITTGTDTSCVKTVTTTDTKTGQTTTNDYPVSNETESAQVFGVATVTSVKSTVGEVTYTRSLTKPITISQTNQQAPKLTYQAAAGMTITVEGIDGVGYASGSMVEGMTALTITATAADGYYNPRVSQPDGALNWTVVSEDKSTAQYTCNMAFVDMTMSSTVQAYPKLTWTADSSSATVEVKVGEKAIANGTNVEPGTEVTVTATAKSDAGYCQPRIAAGSGWTKDEGDYMSTYTFTMPNAAVTIPAPICGTMYRVSWENTESLTITAVDHNETDRTVNSDVNTVNRDDYVIPGHTVIITVTADGGTNPHLTQPTDAVSYGSTASAFIRQYSITMPRQNVTIVATSAPYPLLSFENTFADITLKSNGAVVSTDGVTSKGIKPENTVMITLTAKPGYYAPRMTAPAGVTEFRTVGTPDNKSATYSFKMPNAAVDISAKITARTAKKVTFAGDQASLSIAGKNYDGSAIVSASGVQVQPDTVVTVTVRSKSGYYNPTVSGGGAAETSRTGYDTATYTFTMGTSDVTLTGAGTADPKVTITNSGTSISVKVSGSAVSSGGSIHPGSTVTVTATPDATHYAPRVSAKGAGDWTVSGTPNQDSAAYTFTMGTSPVTLSGTASAKRQLSWSATGVRFTVKVDNLPTESGAYLIPGQKVSVSVQNESGWVDGKVTSSDVTIAASGGTFTMPDKDVTLTGSATPTVSWNCEKHNKYGTPPCSVKNGNTAVSSGAAIAPGTKLTITVEGKIIQKTFLGRKYTSDGAGGWLRINSGATMDKELTVTHKPVDNGTSTSKADATGIFELTMPNNPVSFTAYYETNGGPCVSEDTMITLADGSQKRVDELTGSETLLTWNHKTGSYDTAPVAYLIDHGGVRQEQPITHLFFADGSDLEIIGEHVFYNADTGKYITLDENAADYIGTHFAKQNAESGRLDRVALTDVKHEVKLTGIYEVVTYSDMTCFTDGILTASAYIDKLLNTFDIETDTMAYNPFKVIADIQTYGLYTYEDLQELGLTEAQFNMHNAAFLKIAVGKGTLTWQDMSDLMDMFREYANEMPAAEANVQPNSMAEELPKMFGAYFAAKGQQAVDSVGQWVREVFTQ